MKLGLGSWAYAWAAGVPGWARPASPMGPLELIERAAVLGLRVAQIADNISVEALTGAELARLRERSAELGVEIELGMRGVLGGRIARHVELCRILGARVLRIVVDRDGHEPSPEEVVRTASDHTALLADAGVVLAIENHDRFTAPTLARIVREAASPHIGVCLDTVNSFGSLEGPEAVVDALAGHTVSLHLKDFTIRRAPHMLGFTIEGAPACEGRLDVPWLLGRLRQAGRDPNAILELWLPPEERLEDTLAKEDEWVRRSVRNLRPLILD